MDSPIISAQVALDALRNLDSDSGLPVSQPLAPRIMFDTDEETSVMTAHVTSRAGQMMTADFDVQVPGRWLALSLELGGASLAGFGILGIACNSQSTGTADCRISVRSSNGDGFQDIFFDKHMVSFSETSLHVDALDIAEHPLLLAETAWRNLMFHFTPRSFDVTLNDLRIFVA